jgi:uncharacterized protein
MRLFGAGWRKQLLILLAVISSSLFLFSAMQFFTVVPAELTSSNSVTERTIQVKGNTVRVTIADTQKKTSRGLSGRKGLGPDEGMLFVFPYEDIHAFWMKDMLFSIDILWLDKNGKIVYLKESVSPETFPATFAPETPAKYVLEVQAGYSAKHGVRTGDVIEVAY